MLSCIKVKTFYFCLRTLKCFCDDTVLNWLVFRYTKSSHHLFHTIGTENSHQVVFKRNIKLGFPWIPLSACTTTKLIVYSSCLMTLGTKHKKSTNISNLFRFFFCARISAETNIDSASSHVCRNDDASLFSGLSYDLRFFFMIFSIKQRVSDAFLLQIC